MPGDMADSIDRCVADEGMLAQAAPAPVSWTDIQGRTTPIVLLSTAHLVNAHRFARRKGMNAALVEALAEEIATRGIVLDADGMPTIPFHNTTPVWVDISGRRHPIPQMDTSHLLNAHRFARRAELDQGIVDRLGTEIARRGLSPLP